MMYAYHSFAAECVATPRRDSHIHVQLLTTLAQYAEQGLREGRASVRLSVPPFAPVARHTPLLRVCCCAPGG